MKIHLNSFGILPRDIAVQSKMMQNQRTEVFQITTAIISLNRSNGNSYFHRVEPVRLGIGRLSGLVERITETRAIFFASLNNLENKWSETTERAPRRKRRLARARSDGVAGVYFRYRARGLLENHESETSASTCVRVLPGAEKNKEREARRPSHEE